jgi:hypothetical protein
MLGFTTYTKLIINTSKPTLRMTKEVRDNFDGLTYDEDDSVEFTFVDRHDNRGLIKVEGDVARSTFLAMYGNMVKKPKYQVWVRPTEEEKEQGKKGHWEKLQ